MDAVEFITKRERMCKLNITHCKSCPVDIEIRKRGLETTCYNFQITYPKTFVEIVERWNKEYPIKTRQSEFLKMFPRVSMTTDGVIALCPESMDSAFVCPIKSSYDPECGECRRMYWLEEIK